MDPSSGDTIYKGYCKDWIRDKMYGFIQYGPNEQSDWVFVHSNQLRGGGGGGGGVVIPPQRVFY